MCISDSVHGYMKQPMSCRLMWDIYTNCGIQTLEEDCKMDSDVGTSWTITDQKKDWPKVTDHADKPKCFDKLCFYILLFTDDCHFVAVF